MASYAWQGLAKGYPFEGLEALLSNTGKDGRMPACKITVLKKMFNPDLAEDYRRSDVHFGPCPYYREGDEFIVGCFGERPENFFCDWAWNDLHKILFAMQLGGDFSPWMKDRKTFIACCTDGVKPVVFKLERLDE